MDEDDIHVGEMASRIGYQLRADTTGMEALYEQMAKIGVRPARATALVYNNLHPGCDQTELARVLGINKASTMAAVDGLVALGAVERRPGRDRRSNALHLTDHGRRLRDECVKVIAEHDAYFFRAWRPASGRSCFACLSRSAMPTAQPLRGRQQANKRY